MPPPPAPQGYPHNRHNIHPQQQLSPSPAVQYPPHLQPNQQPSQQVYPYPSIPQPQTSPIYPQHVAYDPSIYQSAPQAQPYYPPQPQQIYAPTTDYVFDAQPAYLHQQGYLSPHQQFIAPSPPIPSPGLVASSPAQLASPAWSQFQAQQVLPDQQTQPADVYFTPVQPSPQPLPLPAAVLTPSPFPQPAPALGDNTANVPGPKITLRLPARSGDAGEMPTRRRTSAVSKTESEESPHMRSARSNRRGGQTVSYAEDDDEDDYDESHDDQPPVKRPTRRGGRTRQHDGDDADGGYGEPDAEGEVDEPQPVVSTRRSSRAHKPTTRFHGEDDFEESIVLDSSPVIARVQPPPPAAPPAGRRSTRRRIAVDPDDEDEDDKPHVNGVDEAPLPPALTHQPVPERPLSQPSRKQRKGSEDDAESFNPSESEQASSSETEADQLDAFVEEPDDGDADSFVSHSPPRRKTTRQTRSAAATRRSTRTRRADPDSDDEYGKKGRNLRKRESRPNYELPPMDISAEIAAADVNRAIASASGPRGGRRPGPTSSFGAASRFGSLGGLKPLPWSVKGKDFAQAMGDPDSSDSDNDLAMANAAAAGPAAALGGGAGVRGPGIPGPTDVPNFGRVNPKSNMADADPLGVDVNVTFDRVGGLDGREFDLKVVLTSRHQPAQGDGRAPTSLS